MERRRLQHQRMKQQQRFCVSQQDLTEAITRMKPTKTDFHVQRRATHESLTNIPSSCSIQTINSRSVSELIKEFEERANAITHYSCGEDLLPIIKGVISSRVEPNFSHMFIRTMKIKGNINDNDIINNNVCSPIPPSINDDNQMVIVETHRHQLADDKKQEKKDEQIHQTLDNDRHKLLLPASSIYTTENNNNNHQYLTQMLTRSTDIDAAALTLGKRHEIHFNELLTKETQLNNALADLLSISNDADQSSSINSSPRSLTAYNECRQISEAKNFKDNSISASINLLNNLLETLDFDDEGSDNKKQKNDDHHVKPINMFW
jgi:hypothetical protein